MNTEKAQKSLQAIMSLAKSSLCFEQDLFESRDVDALCKIGGDICMWTMVAIHADDALKALAQPKQYP